MDGAAGMYEDVAVVGAAEAGAVGAEMLVAVDLNRGRALLPWDVVVLGPAELAIDLSPDPSLATVPGRDSVVQIPARVLLQGRAPN